MKHLTLSCIVLLASALTVIAQKGTLSLTVRDEQQRPLEGATAELRKTGDSSLMKTALSDKNGALVFEQVAYGQYLVRTTMVNHTTQWSGPLQLGVAALDAGTVTLLTEHKALQGVQVTSRKSFIQRLSDRLVVNVENSVINTGSSAFDVLERSPGILIDGNDNLSMRGRAGVIIMIDGKPSPMSGADLVNYLRSLPANAIDRIELITNPSAKYDAAGNAGIIDVRMKKDQRYGANGSLTAGYGQGVYPKANTGINFNYRNKKVNLFGGYNYTYRKNLNHLILDRNFYSDGQFKGQDIKDNYTRIPLNLHALRLGADIFPSKRTVIGFVVNSNVNSIFPANDNSSVVIGSDKQPLFRFNTTSRNQNKNRNTVANLNLKHSFDSLGRELTADIDYGYFGSDNHSLVYTRYRKLDGSPLQPDYILDGVQEGALRLFTVKSDYVHPLKNKARIEAGVKTSLVHTDNDARFFDLSSGSPVNDVNKTNHFFYDENLNAAYLNWKKEAGRWDWQLGLRVENTNVKTRQVKGDVRWDSAYTQLFPSAFLNYKLNEAQKIGLSVSRRIDRPNYAQLNPFLFLIDVTTYGTGNPSLLPQFTWAYELNYTLKNINVTLGYSHTTQAQNIVVTRFRDVFPNIPADDNVTVQIPVNLSSTDYYGLTVAAPFRIRPWWNMLNNVNLFYNHFNGQLGVTRLSRGKAVADLRTNHTFTFKKGWTAELSANYNSGNQYGFMLMRPQWGLGAGIQKSFWQGKGTLRLNITDIFWTNLPRATITYDNYVEIWRAYRESRVANLGFTYRFGNNKVQQARKRSTGSEEERQRAQ